MLERDKLLSREQFEDHYEQYGEAIYRFLYWQTKDQALSQDLTASTFEKAWKARKSFAEGSAKAWFYRIARNLLTDHWRKSRPVSLDDVPGLSDQLEGPGIDYDYDREQEQLALGRALDQLPDRLRAVTTLRFIEGLSAREVAEILGTTEGNVRVLQHRALKQLKQLMEHNEED